MINVVNTRTFNGPHKKYIGRGSPLGNRYSHKEGTKAEFIVESPSQAVSCFEIELRSKLAQKDPEICAEMNSLYVYYKQHGELNLACYCKYKGTEPCHGDVIKRVLEEVI